MQTKIFSITLATFAMLTCVANSPAAETNAPSMLNKSSIQVSVDKKDQKELLALAKVTPDEAKAMGMAVYDGKFDHVKIHNYGGNLAYEVEFEDGMELIIDAGNKAVLQVRFEKNSAFDKIHKGTKK